MKSAMFAASLLLAGLGACSGAPADEGQFNDVATGAMLTREQPLTREPEQRGTRLAECAAVLSVAARQTPPPPRGERMLELAERLHRLSVQVAAARGGAAADVTRTRDAAVAALNQLAANQPDQFAAWLRQGAEGCGMADVMTDEELGLAQPAQPDPIGDMANQFEANAAELERAAQ
jgi:hypothetical protein